MVYKDKVLHSNAFSSSRFYWVAMPSSTFLACFLCNIFVSSCWLGSWRPPLLFFLLPIVTFLLVFNVEGLATVLALGLETCCWSSLAQLDVMSIVSDTNLCLSLGLANISGVSFPGTPVGVVTSGDNFLFPRSSETPGVDSPTFNSWRNTSLTELL